MKNIISITLFLIAVGLLLSLVKTAVDKEEIGECQSWQEQAAQYQGFYVVQWQADQCAAHGITINAPIK